MSMNEKECPKCKTHMISLSSRKAWKCPQCGYEEEIEVKMLPAPESKQEEREIIHLDIDIRDLVENCPEIHPPENQDVWKSPKEQSEEYKKLNSTLAFLALFIARNINEGPEVKDNINKRLILARTILGVIVDNLAITGYDAYGMLMEMQQDKFMQLSGKRHVLTILTEIEQMKIQLAKQRARSYTS